MRVSWRTFQTKGTRTGLRQITAQNVQELKEDDVVRI